MIFAHFSRSFRETFPFRAAEWATAVMLLNWSLVLTINETLFAETPSFSVIATIMQQSTLAMLCGLAGCARLLVLGINGAWRRSPHLRFIGAFIGTGFWFMISLGLLQAGTGSTGLAVYPILMLLDSYNALRAAGEAGIADHLHKGRAAKDDNRI